ncbi:ESF1 homolog isoform X2 [Spea bombifrons]|uniref:ESF1 homolog isoform X2 n=1 Tax=Spea bombifrons TaxID=233779 RepID=UPI00234A7BCD|nr:ESF1 homolog isoform X2 [Spea bombifrons]
MASKKDTALDTRFSRVTKDPRFWEMPEKDKKIKIDKRFQSMFHDKKFNLKYTVDKRGRPMNHSTKEDLKRFYDLSDTDEDEVGDEETSVGSKKGKGAIKAKEKKKRESKPKDKSDKNKLEETEEGKEDNDSQKLKGKDGKLTKGSVKEKAEHTISSSTNKKSEKQGVKIPVQQESEDEESAGLEDDSDEESDEDSDVSEGNDLEIDEDLGSEEESESEDDVSEDGKDDDDDDEEEEEEEQRSGDENEEESDSGPDLARGKGNIETSSEDEDDDDDAEDAQEKDLEIEHAWRELDKDAPRGDEVTNRLAVCNMDWDRLKAKDLLALFNSFKPKGGIVFSVKIYPSEYGKEKLKAEELHGPLELKNLSEDVTDEQGVYKEKLREYQFQRLKYFYAVIECDSPETANKIYEECDGLEFESSCSFVDLRFIPDDVQFNDEPKDSAVDVDLASYKPKLFTSTALSTSKKVELTWDETDHERITTLNRPFKKNEILDLDFQAYLASSSEEEEDEEECAPDTEAPAGNEDTKSKKSIKDDEEQIARYRELLKGIQEKDKKRDNEMEMEVKWVPGLKENAEKMIKDKLEGKDKLTPWERYLQKQKDKRKMKKRKKVTLHFEESNEEEEVPSDVDFNDPYFSEELKKPGLKNKSTSGKKEGEQSSSEDEAENEKQQAEMALLMMDDVEDDRKHFNYDKIVEHQNLTKKKKKQLKKKEQLLEDDFQIDVEDTRFQALYTSHLYNVDPSDPGFKKTKAMERVIEEKARRREQKPSSHAAAVKEQETKLENVQQKGTSAVKTTDPALSMLLKSVKNKTQQFQASKKQKTK